MNTENFEQSAPDASLTREEAVALHDKLLASNIALSKKTAVLCFIGAVAAFIIGSIFQGLAGTTMFSMYTYTDSVILATLASPTFYLGWAGVVIGIIAGVVSIRTMNRQKEAGLSRKDLQELHEAAAKLQESDPEEAQKTLDEANQLEKVLDALGK